MRDTRNPNTQQASQIQKLLSIKKLHTGTTTHKWKFLDAAPNSLYLANFELASRLVPNIFRHSSTSLQLLSCCSQTNTMHIQSDTLQQLGNHTLSVTKRQLHVTHSQLTQQQWEMNGWRTMEWGKGGGFWALQAKSLATQFAHVIHDEMPERGLKVPTLYHQIGTLYTDSGYRQKEHDKVIYWPCPVALLWSLWHWVPCYERAGREMNLSFDSIKWELAFQHFKQLWVIDHSSYSISISSTLSQVPKKNTVHLSNQRNSFKHYSETDQRNM
jgi:hypothetical protein